MATEIDIAVTTTTYNVSITAEPNEYIVNITTNGGSGIESVTGTTVDNTDPLNPIVEVPSLTQVLTVGDKAPDSISGDRTWQPADRLKYWQVQSGIQTLDDTVFPDGSLIEGVIQNDDINATVTFDFDSANCFYLDQNITTLTLNVGDFFQLKHFSVGAWILTVANKSIGAAWGSITGTLADQTDLQTALDAKVDKVAGSRLITSAESTLLGNTSGTNSGDNATNTKYDVTATTGAVISFATPQIYNSIASPSASNITDNLTGARIGVVQKIYHNAGTTPTFPAGWVRRGTGTYVTSTLNIIYAEWSVGTTVEYWITQ